ncbi:MAG: tetratricopeptide repeat protein [Candidatus Omnitrophica bacterium]|nr:tetratricopeptide repeat protein [Candidatus Omnitrophota bacterium]
MASGARTDRFDWLLPLLIAAGSLFLYLPALQLGFTNWDDNMYVLQNPVIHALTWDRIQKIFTSLIFANYHPLTLLSYACQYAWFGSNPLGYHAVSVLFHAGNGALVYALARALTGARWTAFFVACIFAVHPLQVESVAWISSQKTLESGFFSLLSILSYLRFLDRKSKRWYALALLFFAIALFFKPTAVTLPLVLILADALLHKTRLTEAVFRAIPFLALSLLEASLVFIAHQTEKAFAPIPGDDRLNFTVVPFWTVSSYLRKIFWPSDLLPLYPTLKSAGWSDLRFGLPAAAVISLLILLAVNFWRSRRSTFFGCFFLLLLLPTLNLFPLSAPLADRYTYLPLIGPLGLAGLFLHHAAGRFIPRPAVRAIVLGLPLLILIPLFQTTRAGIAHWKDSKTLWSYVLSRNPLHALAHVKYGEAVYETGDLDQAIAEIREGIRLGLNNPLFAKNLVAMYIDKGELDLARESALEFVKRTPGDERFYIQLGIIESGTDAGKAEKYFLRATELNPRNPSSWYQLGRFYLARDAEKAYSCFLKSLALDPYDPHYHVAVADCFSRSGNYDKAVEALQYALTLDEHFTSAWFNLGMILKQKGLSAESDIALKRAYELDPSLARRETESQTSLSS